jgi:oligopeptide transport system substrate-binding protein
MHRKRWLILVSLMLAAFVLAACGGGAPAEVPVTVTVDDEALSEAEAQIAELEAALADAAEAGSDDEAVADLEAQLADAQAAADEAQAMAAEAEAAAAEAASAQCTYNAYRMGWIMDYSDANNMVNEVFGPTSDFQYTFWGNNYPDEASSFEGLVDDALADLDAETRAATWQQAESILIDNVDAVIPLYHYDRINVVNPDLNTLYPPFGAPKVGQWSFTSGKTTLVAPLGAAVPTLDIQDSTDTTSSFVIGQMIDAPYRYTEEGTVEPAAATSYDVSEDGTVYTIHLREGALWSDGEPVTAQHYVDGIKRLLSPDMANDYAYVMFAVEGAAEYNAGESDTLDSVRVVDDNTFEVQLSAPLSYFESILAFTTMHPVRLDIIDQYGDAWTEPGNFVSNGAYVLAEHEPGDMVVLEKNPNYWDADNVSIERIELPIIVEPATSLAAYENGEVDMTNAMDGGFPAEDTPRLVEGDDFVRLPRPGTYYLGLNTSAQHTDNVNFRQALSYAVDKRTILDEVAETPWRIEAYGVIPPEIPGYQGDAVGYGYDPEAAQASLQAYMDEAGIADPSEIVIELWYNKSGDNQLILEAVEAMWEANLGIDVRTVNVEWATYLDTLEECNAIGGGGF